MDWVSNPDMWVGLTTLTTLEIVLGVDNVIFISILAGACACVIPTGRARRHALRAECLAVVLVVRVTVMVD